MSLLRTRMCSNKVSFRTRGKAEAIASRFGQRIYECPICFCWHCTNKENWREEFFDTAEHKRALIDLERRLRTEFNEKLREKNSQIKALELIIRRLKHGHTDEETK